MQAIEASLALEILDKKGPVSSLTSSVVRSRQCRSTKRASTGRWPEPVRLNSATNASRASTDRWSAKILYNRSASHHWASGSLSSASQSSHHSIGPISIVPVYSFPLMASCISSSESAENLQPRGETGIQGLTRVPAPVTAAHAALAHAHPDTMEPLGDDSRDHVRASTSGGVAQRWILGSSAQRRPQA